MIEGKKMLRERKNEDLKIFHVVNLNWMAYLRGDHAGMILLFSTKRINS